jgi:hypothetical protein
MIMAEEIIPPSKLKDESNPALYLVGSTGYDTIQNAICALEFLNEVLSEYTGESVAIDEEDNVIHGRWIVLGTIARTLRHGQQQLGDERARSRINSEVHHG